MVTVSVSSLAPVSVSTAGTPNDRLTVAFPDANRSSGTIYYGLDKTVSSTNNIGSITPGNSITLDRTTYYFIAARAANGSHASGLISYFPPVNEEEQLIPGVLVRVNGRAIETSTDHGSTWLSAQTAGSVPPGWYDVKATYGAVGDGVTDDTSAVQSAITAAKAAGGTVYLPPGSYKITSSLNCQDNSKPWTLRGAGGGGHNNIFATQLIYTPTTGSLLDCRSSVALEICHLHLDYSSATYSGDLLNFDQSAGAGNDALDFSIHHCASKGLASSTARSIIRLNRAIIGSIEKCHFSSAVNCLRLGDPGGAYVVGVQVEKCTFNFSTDAHILIGSGDGESLTIRDCTFEAGVNTPGIKGSSCQLYAAVIENNWFGDAGSAVGWISGLTGVSSNSPGIIRGNMFGSNGSPHVSIIAGNWTIEGNHFEGGTAFDFSTGDVQFIGNYFNNCTIFASFRPTNLVALGNISSVSTETSVLRNTVPPRLALGTRNGGIDLSGGPADNSEQLILGASGVAGLQDLGNRAGVYAYQSGGNPFALALQAPQGLNPEVQMVGSNRTPVVRISDNKLAFYNTGPITQPNTTGTATGFTAGSGTAVNDASTFTGGTGATAYRISDIVKALKNLGLLAS